MDGSSTANADDHSSGTFHAVARRQGRPWWGSRTMATMRAAAPYGRETIHLAFLTASTTWSRPAGAAIASERPRLSPGEAYASVTSSTLRADINRVREVRR